MKYSVNNKFRTFLIAAVAKQLAVGDSFQLIAIRCTHIGQNHVNWFTVPTEFRYLFVYSQLAVNYVIKIPHVQTITCQDVKAAISIDKVCNTL